MERGFLKDLSSLKLSALCLTQAAVSLAGSDDPRVRRRKGLSTEYICLDDGLELEWLCTRNGEVIELTLIVPRGPDQRAIIFHII